jgi:Bacterial regulatory proteins, tetR family.
MARKSPPHASADAVIDAALALAAEKGWRGLALADIAERAKVPLAELVEHFPARAAILDAYARRIDHAMLAGGSDPAESHRDRLFDVVMRRFEAMAKDRRALAAILRQSGDDPWAVLCGGRRFAASMALVLETAGLSSSGLGGMIRTSGIGAVYLYAFKNFLDDDSADLARTMAVLDRALRRGEDVLSLISRRSGPPRANPTTDLR